MDKPADSGSVFGGSNPLRGTKLTNHKDIVTLFYNKLPSSIKYIAIFDYIYLCKILKYFRIIMNTFLINIFLLLKCHLNK
jgi:hypothetical protein